MTACQRAKGAVMPTRIGPTGVSRAALQKRLSGCRARTLELIDGLSDADVTVQSMDDASPSKWHLAHTSWFFEEFVLGPFLAGYRPADARYRYLFNAYYEAVGARHPRPRRGLLTRPTIDEVIAYRRRVDDALFAQNPLRPAYRSIAAAEVAAPVGDPPPPAAGTPAWVDYDGGRAPAAHLSQLLLSAPALAVLRRASRPRPYVEVGCGCIPGRFPRAARR